MPKCWTYGEPQLVTTKFTCEVCNKAYREVFTQIKEAMPKIRAMEKVDSWVRGLIPQQREALEYLVKQISRHGDLSAVIEWSFEELIWQMNQRFIDLVPASESDKARPDSNRIKSEECRQIGEELRIRGILTESEENFLRALQFNPRDYRIYRGVAETYLRMEKLDEALRYLEKSRRLAPTGRWEGVSLRLIGRIYFCQDKIYEAISILNQAIKKTSDFYWAYYDLAQYHASIVNKSKALENLRIAIDGDKGFFRLAYKSKMFDPIREDTDRFLSDLLVEIKAVSGGKISTAKSALANAQAIEAEQMAPDYCSKAQRLIKEADDKYHSGEYEEYFLAARAANEAYKSLAKAISIAEEARKEKGEKQVQKMKETPGLTKGMSFAYKISVNVGMIVIVGTLGNFLFGGWGILLGAFVGFGLAGLISKAISST